MDEKFINSNYKLDDAKKKEIDDVRSIIRDTVMDFHNYVYPKYIMNYNSNVRFEFSRISSKSKKGNKLKINRHSAKNTNKKYARSKIQIYYN